MVSTNIVIATIVPLLISYVLTDYKWDRVWYASLKKAPLNPPSWIFPIVWPILYLMMGYASGLIVEKVGWFSLPILVYAIQLILNLTWSKIFFINEDPDSAFKQLLLTLILVSITIYLFYRVDKKAAYLLVPYLMWLLFAAYLNGYIVRNN